MVMSPSATNPALTQSGDYPNFFRTIASDDAQARLEVDFALDDLKVTKIAVLHDKGDYGKGLAEFAKAFLEKAMPTRPKWCCMKASPPAPWIIPPWCRKSNVRCRSGNLRRLSSGSLQDRHPDAKKEDGYHFHFR